MLSQQQKEAAAAALKEALAFAAEESQETPWKRFARNLVVTLARRAPEDVPGESATFVMAAKPGAFVGLPNAMRVIDLDRPGNSHLGGKIFIVGEGANGGVELPALSHNDMIELLNGNDLGDAPCATYYMGQGAVRIYPNGLASIDDQLELPIRGAPVAFSFSAVIDAITYFVDRNLITPQKTMTGFWERQTGWLPTGTAEDAIQWPLRIALAATFAPDVVVIEEYETSIGNVDFVFVSASAGPSDPPLALVETKVQKSFRDSGEVQPFETGKELIRGMIQVVAYSRALKVEWGALACFDLRKPGQGGDVAWANAEMRCQRVLTRLEARTGHPLNVRNWLVFAQAEAAQAAQAMTSMMNADPLYAARKRPDYQAQLQSSA